jgi:hypothetical protein
MITLWSLVILFLPIIGLLAWLFCGPRASAKYPTSTSDTLGAAGKV